MMSLTRINLGKLVQKQYLYKLKSFSGVFTTLMILQAIGIFFSVVGGDYFGSSSSKITVNVQFFSAEQVILFTMLWMFFTAIIITTKAYREDNFTFVTNRLSNNLANGLFLLTASIIAGTTSYLSGFLVRIIMRFFNGLHIGVTGLPDTLYELSSGLIGLMLIFLILAVIGYLVGTLVQLNRIFIVILPVVFFGFTMLSDALGEKNIAAELFNFYFTESSIVLFAVKIIATSIILFVMSTLLSNRQEVRL